MTLLSIKAIISFNIGVIELNEMNLTEQSTEEYIERYQDEFENSLAEAVTRGASSEVRKIIKSSHVADLAGFFNRSSSSQKEKILNLLSEQQISQLVVELDISVIPVVIEMIGAKKTSKIMNLIDADDAVYVLDSLEEELRDEILKHLNKTKTKEITEEFSYPEDSAGRLMQKKFISISEHWTIAQAIDYMKSKQKSSEVFHEIFVTNSKFTPIGSVRLSDLLSKPGNLLISKIMNVAIKAVQTDLEDTEVSFLFKKYGFVTIPVVNKHSRLVGVITLTDVFEVTDKNAEESIMHMGGVREDDVYLNVIEVVKSRFPWLLISLLATSICALVVNHYHDTIQQAVILSAIMPIIAGISGNAGTQTMTVTVLSIAGKEITSLNIFRVIRNQIISCTCNGLVLACLGGGVLALLHQNTTLSLVFGLAVTINFALAGFLGSIIPIVLDKLNFDPAIASSVFVTTATDVLSFGIFLSLATQLLI